MIRNGLPEYCCPVGLTETSRNRLQLSQPLRLGQSDTTQKQERAASQGVLFRLVDRYPSMRRRVCSKLVPLWPALLPALIHHYFEKVD